MTRRSAKQTANLVDDSHDAVRLAELVREKQIKPSELVNEAIERAETLNPSLNAMVHTQFERAQRDARKAERLLAKGLPGDELPPFLGVPFVLKDYGAEEADEPYRMGVRALQELDYRPRKDSLLAQRFRSLGLIPIGRSNVPEMALMGTTEPELFGPTCNPWDTTRSPGGSSGGAAALVSARIVPAAHANDISGSIRIPAAMCGLVGLKATRGRICTNDGSNAPVGMQSEGVVTRSVRDTAAFADALSSTSAWWPSPQLPRPLRAEVGVDPGRLRIGVDAVAFNGSRVDDQNEDAALETGRLLDSMGHLVINTSPPELSEPELWDLAKKALQLTAAAEAEAWTARIGRSLGESDVEALSWEMIRAGNAISGPRALRVIEGLQRIVASAARWWNNYDLLVTPTTAGPPSMLGDYRRGYESGRGSAFTRPFNITGQPAISLPLCWPEDGLPRGVQLIAPYGREDVLIRVASALEAALPWAHRRPPVS